MRIRNNKPKLIALNGDVPTLRQISQAGRDYYQVVPVTDPHWAMAWLALYRDVSVFLVSESLAGEGLSLLRKAQIMRSDVIRVLLTHDMDQPAMVEALERDAASYLLQTPFDDKTLLDLICPENVGFCTTPQRVFAY